MTTTNVSVTRRDAAEASNLLLTTETAGRLNISKRGLQELVADRKIGFIKFGRNIRFSQADIDTFIESHRNRPIGWKANANRGAVAR
jgi:excisionase family DNA binding protein